VQISRPSTDWVTFDKDSKELKMLSQKSVQCVEKNVRADKTALKELLDKGSQSTPVTIIDGQSVVGFDQAKIMELLGL
jgi:glutaredoxin